MTLLGGVSECGRWGVGDRQLWSLVLSRGQEECVEEPASIPRLSLPPLLSPLVSSGV